MRFLIQTWSLLTVETKVLLRDRQALVLLLVMPTAFILLLSIALKNVFNEKLGVQLPVVIESFDHGAGASSVARMLRLRTELRFVERGAVADNEVLFRRGLARAVITIPDGFSQDLWNHLSTHGMEPFGEHPIVWEADPTLDATYRWFIRAALALAVNEAILEQLAGLQPGVGRPGGGEDAGRTAASGDGFLRQAPARTATAVLPTPLQQSVPAWSLFAMFFIVVPLSASVIRDRQDGTLRRLLTYPVSRPAIVVGKLAPYLVANIAQFGLMLLVGLWVVPRLAQLSFGLGNHPENLVPVTLAAALAATGYGIMVAALARTIEQASAFGAISVIIMALVGGVMVPSFVIPQAMQRLALLSPLHWALQAYHDGLLRDAPLASILPALALLVAFAAVCFTVAAVRVRRT